MSTPKIKIRLSQLVGTYGIGAIYDAPGHSLIVCEGTWRNLRLIKEDRLSHKLNGVELFAPEVDEESDIVETGNNPFSGSVPLRVFPEFLHCKRCHKIKRFIDWGGFNVTDCPTCDEPLIPSRLVVACTNGHLDDFPWLLWAHSGKNCSNAGTDKDITIKSKGLSTSLADLLVTCSKCKSCRDLGDSMFPAKLHELGYGQCRGGAPWSTNKTKEECSAIAKGIKVLQRSASNVFFCQKESVISIPPYSGKAYEIIEKNLDSLDGYTNIEDVALQGTLKRIAEKNKLSLNDLVNAYAARTKLKVIDFDAVNVRDEEFSILCSPPLGSDFEDDFHAVSFQKPISKYPIIKSVTLVHRLRVVSAQTGFMRVEQGGSTQSDDSPNVSEQRINPVRMGSNAPWRLACEVHGEGIFIQLDMEIISRWIKSNEETLSERYKHILSRARNQSKILNRMKLTPTIELMTLHTISHLLINELSISSGYSSSSISERLYQIENPNTKEVTGLGVLIYTSSSDSEGSLGGLVQQGEGNRLIDLLDKSISSANWCSNDPLCFETDSVQGQGTDGLNLAACHTCALLPETACELCNSFLDRGLLISLSGMDGLINFQSHV
jgi:hypothetical protein